MSEKNRRTAANIMLLSAGAIWGGGFVVMKSALDAISVNYLLAIRFSIGALGLMYTLCSKKHPVTVREIIGGIVTGSLLYASFAVQTYGLMYTTAGKNALITAVYVVLVPFILWLRSRQRPELRVMAASVMLLLGVGLLSLQKESGINIGDLLTFFCGIGYALHIVFVDEFSKDADVMQLTCLQFCFSALFAWAAALIFERPPANIGSDTVVALAYCGIAATLLGLTFQNVGIKYASPEYASLFVSTESAFGCIFGVLFLHEGMTGRMWLGCGLILGALVLSQVDWNTVIKRKRSKENETGV